MEWFHLLVPEANCAAWVFSNVHVAVTTHQVLAGVCVWYFVQIVPCS